MVIGVWMGIRGAWKRGGKFDNVSTGTSLTLYSMPEWWLGLMLIAVFAVGFGPIPGMFPTGGLHSVDVDPSSIEGVLDTIWHLTLPVITLTLAYLADYTLIMRSSLLDELGEDYLTTARAKGLRDVQVRNRHAVRNALLPTTTLVALSIGSIVAGAITVETVFSIPGLGLLATEALSVPDYWVLQGTFLVAYRRRDPGQPGRQPGLRPPRPAGPDMTTTDRRRLGPRAGASPATRVVAAQLGDLPHPPGRDAGAGGPGGLRADRHPRPDHRAGRGSRGDQGDRRGPRAAVRGSSRSAPTTRAGRC